MAASGDRASGVAYSPDFLGNGHKTVIRAGFGVFYDVVFTNIIDNIQATAPNAASPVITSSANSARTRGTANWYEQFANLNPNPLPTNTQEPISNHLLSPRTMHWNLNVEQELPWSTTFQVGYVGERGTHLYGNTNLNPYINDTESLRSCIPDARLNRCPRQLGRLAVCRALVGTGSQVQPQLPVPRLLHSGPLVRRRVGDLHHQQSVFVSVQPLPDAPWINRLGSVWI